VLAESGCGGLCSQYFHAKEGEADFASDCRVQSSRGVKPQVPKNGPCLKKLTKISATPVSPFTVLGAP
jgi:hypothetical protein